MEDNEIIELYWKRDEVAEKWLWAFGNMENIVVR